MKPAWATRSSCASAPPSTRCRALPVEEQFDVAFVDADKPNYPVYIDEIVPRLRVGGVIMVDNTLWGGTVADAAVDDDGTSAMRAFNDKVAGSPPTAVCAACCCPSPTASPSSKSARGARSQAKLVRAVRGPLTPQCGVVPSEHRLSERSEREPKLARAVRRPMTPQCGVVPSENRLSERSERQAKPSQNYENSRSFQPGKMSGRPSLTLTREDRRTLLQERRDALRGRRRCGLAPDGAGVDAVGFHRMVGAEHAPHHQAGQRHAHRRRVVGDLARRAPARRAAARRARCTLRTSRPARASCAPNTRPV